MNARAHTVGNISLSSLLLQHVSVNRWELASLLFHIQTSDASWIELVNKYIGNSAGVDSAFLLLTLIGKTPPDSIDPNTGRSFLHVALERKHKMGINFLLGLSVPLNIVPRYVLHFVVFLQFTETARTFGRR